MDILEASRIGIVVIQKLLWAVLEKEEQVRREILRAGEPLRQEVKRLLTIKGITPLTTLATLADVGEVRRLKSLRNVNAYLGLVPKSMQHHEMDVHDRRGLLLDRASSD